MGKRKKRGRCTICENEGYTEWHHIISRHHAIRTGQEHLLDNPLNTVELCKWCHDQTTASMVRRLGGKAIFTSITGLWRDNGKVAFSGKTREEITIPAGTKILAFKRQPEQGTRQPDLGLVYVSYEDQTHQIEGGSMFKDSDNAAEIPRRT